MNMPLPFFELVYKKHSEFSLKTIPFGVALNDLGNWGTRRGPAAAFSLQIGNRAIAQLADKQYADSIQCRFLPV
jgi:hypothetical protein